MFNTVNLTRRVSVDLTSTFEDTRFTNKPYFVWTWILSVVGVLSSFIGATLYYTEANTKHSVTWHLNTFGNVMILLVALIIRNKLLEKDAFAKLIQRTDYIYFPLSASLPKSNNNNNNNHLDSPVNGDANADNMDNMDDMDSIDNNGDAVISSSAPSAANNNDANDVNERLNVAVDPKNLLAATRFVNYMPFSMFAGMLGTFTLDLSVGVGVAFYLVSMLCMLRALSGLVHVRKPQSRGEWGIYLFYSLLGLVLIISYNVVLADCCWDFFLNIMLLIPFFWAICSVLALATLQVVYYCDKLYRIHSFAMRLLGSAVLLLVYAMLMVFNADYWENQTNLSRGGGAGVVLMGPVYTVAMVCAQTSMLALHGVWKGTSEFNRDAIAVKSLIADSPL